MPDLEGRRPAANARSAFSCACSAGLFVDAKILQRLFAISRLQRTAATDAGQCRVRGGRSLDWHHPILGVAVRALEPGRVRHGRAYSRPRKLAKAERAEPKGIERKTSRQLQAASSSRARSGWRGRAVLRAGDRPTHERGRQLRRPLSSCSGLFGFRLDVQFDIVRHRSQLTCKLGEPCARVDIR